MSKSSAYLLACFAFFMGHAAGGMDPRDGLFELIVTTVALLASIALLGLAIYHMGRESD